MPRVSHFEIHADDPQRAVAFYTAVFGWDFQPWGGPMDYWMVTTGPDDEPGINGGLLRRQGAVTGEGVSAYVCTMTVDDLDATLARALESGATLAFPKEAIPGIGWLAYAKDTEGNVFGMMQEDPTAGV